MLLLVLLYTTFCLVWTGIFFFFILFSLFIFFIIYLLCELVEYDGQASRHQGCVPFVYPVIPICAIWNCLRDQPTERFCLLVFFLYIPADKINANIANGNQEEENGDILYMFTKKKKGNASISRIRPNIDDGSGLRLHLLPPSLSGWIVSCAKADGGAFWLAQLIISTLPFTLVRLSKTTSLDRG